MLNGEVGWRHHLGDLCLPGPGLLGATIVPLEGSSSHPDVLSSGGAHLATYSFQRLRARTFKGRVYIAIKSLSPERRRNGEALAIGDVNM